MRIALVCAPESGARLAPASAATASAPTLPPLQRPSSARTRMRDCAFHPLIWRLAMKRCSTTAWSFLILLLCLLPASSAHAIALAIAPAETTVTLGDPVVLRVLVDAVPDLKAAELVYGYTPLLISFSSAQVGNAMEG